MVVSASRRGMLAMRGEVIISSEIGSPLAAVPWYIRVGGTRRMSAFRCSQPHLPEICLQPRRLAEERSQLCKAPFCHRPCRQIVKMTARPGGDALVGLAGIFADPFAIGMVAERVNAVRHQVAADLGIADDARGQRDMKVEQVAGRAAIQHEAGIGDGCLMFRCRLDVLRRKSPTAAQPDVKIHLVEDGSKPRLCCPHVGERTALVGGERIGAGELDQEQVVLPRYVRNAACGSVPAPNWRTN